MTTEPNAENVEQQEQPSAADKVVAARQALAAAEMDERIEAAQERKDELDAELAELERRKAGPGAKPAPPVQEQQTEEPPVAAAAEPYTLEVPADLPATGPVIESWTPVLEEFSTVASESGLHQGIAQQLVDAFVDADLALGGYGKNEFTPAYSPDDCAAVLKRFWSTDYDAQLAKVRATVKTLGPKFTEWLEETELGNNPGVLIALSMRSDMDLSQNKAQEELTKLMQSKPYLKGDKVTIARVKVLSRLANASDVRHESVPRTWETVAAEKTVRTQQDARAEAAALIKKTAKAGWSPADKQKFIELTAKLG